MNSKFTAVAVQTCASRDKRTNLDRAAQLAREARAAVDPLLIAFPEVFSWRGRPFEERDAAEPLDGPTVTRMAELARELACWLLLGSFLETSEGEPDGGGRAAASEASVSAGRSPGSVPIRPHGEGSTPTAAQRPVEPGEARPYNTSLLLDPQGQVHARYRKIHLFDVHLDGVGAVRESATRAPGDAAVVASLPMPGGGAVKLGLSVCYDLRFPELYRAHSLAGAQVLMVPAAFTARTGRDHWLALLRARAIENLCWVVAPNQHGTGGEGIETYGRSSIVDPWGTVVATAADGEGWTSAVIDLEQQRAIRERFPALDHRRPDVRAP